MVQFLRNIRNLIIKFIDFFYFPAFRFIPREVFRYAATGGMNTIFDLFLYFVVYKYILDMQIVELGFVAISAYIAAFLIVFPITFTSGFILAKYVTFNTSELKGRIQLFRYLVVFFINLTINYIGLKILVDIFGFYPTPSNMLISSFTIVVSYFSQKHYTFKTSNLNL